MSVLFGERWRALSRRASRADPYSNPTSSSPLWSAPEVLQHGKASEASDVYSFGVIFWELLTRAEPFSHRTRASVAHLSRDIVAVNRAAPLCSRSVDD